MSEKLFHRRSVPSYFDASQAEHGVSKSPRQQKISGSHESLVDPNKNDKHDVKEPYRLRSNTLPKDLAKKFKERRHNVSKSNSVESSPSDSPRTIKRTPIRAVATVNNESQRGMRPRARTLSPTNSGKLIAAAKQAKSRRVSHSAFGRNERTNSLEGLNKKDKTPSSPRGRHSPDDGSGDIDEVPISTADSYIEYCINVKSSELEQKIDRGLPPLGSQSFQAVLHEFEEIKIKENGHSKYELHPKVSRKKSDPKSPLRHVHWGGESYEKA